MINHIFYHNEGVLKSSQLNKQPNFIFFFQLGTFEHNFKVKNEIFFFSLEIRNYKNNNVINWYVNKLLF